VTKSTLESVETSTESTVVRPFISFWWAFYALFAIGYPLFAMLTETTPPPYMGKVEPFVLTTELGEPMHFGNDDRPVVVNFIYTRCPDICPLLTAKMAELQKRIPAKDALLLSISVDPNYDTPEVLKAYGTQFEADFSRWHFLTGEEKQTRAVVESFQTVFETIPQADGNTPNILHSEQFILVDQFGEIRGFFDDSPRGLNDLMQAVNAL